MVYKQGDWQRHWSERDTPWRSGAQDRQFMGRYAEFAGRFGWGAQTDAFVPLCGDSAVIPLLREGGCNVTALDFEPLALKRLREERFRGIEFAVRREGEGVRHLAEGLELREQDIFSFSAPSAFDLIYDSVALIALPRHERQRYGPHLATMLRPHGVLVLVTRVFDDTKLERPPYSVTKPEVDELFASLTLLEETAQPLSPLAERFVNAGITEVTEQLFILRRE